MLLDTSTKSVKSLLLLLFYLKIALFQELEENKRLSYYSHLKADFLVLLALDNYQRSKFKTIK